MTGKPPPLDTELRALSHQNAKSITRVEEMAYDLKIGQVMSRKIITVRPDMRMVDAVDIFRQNRISGAPVVNEAGEMVGIISMEALIRSLLDFEQYAFVEKYMSPYVITVQEHEAVVVALERFAKSNVGRLPVIDADGKLIGMLTKGDVTRGVLENLQNDIQQEELRRYRASHLFEDILSDRTSLILRYDIKQGDFIHGGNASSKIKRALIRLGANPQLARRCGIAIYEAEMNLIIHTTSGGILRVQIEPYRILIRTTDDGPGIPDVAQALRPGFSTATEAVREMGFGAGMGLPNMQRCVDRLTIDSTPTGGTRLEMEIFLQDADSFQKGKTT
jgi:CBS domain-containing protein/anti-sigma regulatory factor (Ser/Thr protein kinase)